MIPKLSKFGKSRPAQAGVRPSRARKNRVHESIIVSGVFVVFLLSIFAFFIYQNVNMDQKRSILEERLQDLRVQASELSAQKTILEANVAGIQSKEYQEKILREQGLYQKEGEQVITILPPEDAVKDVSSSEDEKNRLWWNPLTW